MQIHERLKRYRRAKGMTQEEVAERIGVSRPTLYFWESGRYVPSYDNIKKLADLYGETAERLLGLED